MTQGSQWYTDTDHVIREDIEEFAVSIYTGSMDSRAPFIYLCGKFEGKYLKRQPVLPLKWFTTKPRFMTTLLTGLLKGATMYLQGTERARFAEILRKAANQLDNRPPVQAAQPEVEEFDADAVMAIFGPPATTGDDVPPL